MQGLRTKESKEFLKFFEKVQSKAETMDKVFFMDTGECLDIEFKGMLIDELSGWLIPNGKVEIFEKKFNNELNLDEFIDLYIWCIPTINENDLEIEFKNF